MVKKYLQFTQVIDHTQAVAISYSYTLVNKIIE